MIKSILLFMAVAYVASPLFSQEFDTEKEKTFLPNTRQLIYEGKRSGEGYFSEDGRYLIFQSERIDENPFYQIYTLDLEEGDVELVSPGYGKTTCAYFEWGGGDRVLYASSHEDPLAKQKMQDELDFRASGKKRRYSWDYEKEMEIYSANRDGSDVINLTNTLGYDAEGSYSPDGKYIAFASTRSAYDRELNAKEQKQLEVDPSYFAEIYIMDADGKNVKRLTKHEGYDGGPFFSPDGKRIIWRRFTADGHKADIYSMNVDGTDVRQLTDFNAMSWAPYYHPSMEYVIFASNKLGYSNFELYMIDREGTKEPIRVTHTDNFDGLPVFSPDGKTLVWTSSRTAGGDAQLFMSSWNHKAALEAIEAAPLRGSKAQIDFTPEIELEEIKAKVSYLASDELEGRMTGSEGIRLAADYISNIFLENGLEPIGDDYWNEFEFTSSVNIDANKNSMKYGGNSFTLFSEYVPHASSTSGSYSAEVAFVNYGIKTRDDAPVDINSYTDIDVTDKIVMVMEGLPGYIDSAAKKKLYREADLMYKILIAREMGAKGFIYLLDRNELPKPGLRSSSVYAGMPVIYMSYEGADAILKEKKITLDQIIEEMKQENPHFESSFTLSQEMSITTDVEKVRDNDYNVVGMVKAGNGSEDYIVIGAHYDHLGHGAIGSRATAEEMGEIHNGADDNASGTAVVLELAEYFAELKKKSPEKITRNLVFALWSGEEMGLLGSQSFIEKPPIPLKRIEAYLNFDMVGNLKDNSLSMQGLGSSSEWRKILEKKNIMAGFQLAMSDDPYLPTDAMSFYKADVPVAAFFTGLTDNYHRPTDDANTLNYEGSERIAEFAASVTKELLKSNERLPFTKVKMNEPKVSRGFSVYLGTIPDYVAQVEGVKISGTKPDGPAEKAGIKPGDILVSLAGREIKNIYDYTNILSDMNPDEEYALEVLRNGERVGLVIVAGKK